MSVTVILYFFLLYFPPLVLFYTFFHQALAEFCCSDSCSTQQFLPTGSISGTRSLPVAGLSPESGSTDSRALHVPPRSVSGKLSLTCIG